MESESAESWRFWSDFFAVFGVRRRVLTVLQMWADEILGGHGRIGLFWPGMMLVEDKSPSESLDYAASEARRSIAGLVIAGRHDDVPRYVIASDFSRISLLDLQPEGPIKEAVQAGYRIVFPLCGLPRHVHDFAFILETSTYAEMQATDGQTIEFQRYGRELADFHRGDGVTERLQGFVPLSQVLGVRSRMNRWRT